MKKCEVCGAEFVPDLEDTNEGTNDWSGHSFKPTCDHFPENVRVSIG